MPFNVECFRLNLTAQEANDSVPMSSLGGERAPGPSIAVVFWIANGIIPEDCAGCSIQGFPSNRTSVGASGGSISVTCTFTNTGDDKNFGITGGGSVNLPNGFWGADIRALVAAANFDDVTCDFVVQSLGLDPTDASDFSGPALTDTPRDTAIEEQNYDPVEEEGDVRFSWDYDNADSEDPDGFSIVRTIDGGAVEPVGSIPWVDGTVSYEFTDYIIEPGEYIYSIYAYKYSGPSVSAPVTLAASFGGATPDITFTGTLQADFALEATFVFIGDPSGIYTMTEDARHDTLYERTDVDFIEVAIPTPFVKTGFVP